MIVHAFAAKKAGGKLEPFQYEIESLKPDEVEIEVLYCGICHSDLHMLNNDWSITQYPFVPGHEIVGRISAIGEMVTHLKIGQHVGVGWRSRSCMTCYQCLSGFHNRCLNGIDTIVGKHGGFSDKIHCQSIWAFPIPDNIDIKTAGPLFCGGITVFNPILQNNIKSTDSVAVVGIGGLGHMAIKFFTSWGCKVTAFSTTPHKEKEARLFGAHDFMDSKDLKGIKSAKNKFNMILVTSNADLDWDIYINMLAPGGKLHIVGAVDQIKTKVFPLISLERSIGGSPTGSPATILNMLEFCNHHQLDPVVEEFPLSKVNEAFQHLKSNKARYRIVLRNDL